MARSARLIRLALAGAFVWIASAGCARVPRAPRGPETLATRYAEGRARREQALGAARADFVVRVDSRAFGKLPAFSATVLLAAPQRARLQAHGLLGVAFDAGAREDSLLIRWPAERAAFVLEHTGETLGVASPAAFLARTLGATWQPPELAWRTARVEPGARRLAWREGADSLELELDDEARPRNLALRRGRFAVEVRYDTWARVRGREFPTAFTVLDSAGAWRVRVEVEDLRFAARAEEEWFDWRIPGGTRVLGWEDARDLFRQEATSP